MKNTKNFIYGLLLGCLIATGLPVMASGVNAKIDVVLDAVRVRVDGREVQASSILYNGKTYLGMREVAELVGKEVIWNQETFTANIAEKGAAVEPEAEQPNQQQKEPVFETLEYKNGSSYITKIDGIEHYTSVKLVDIFREHGFSHDFYAPDAGYSQGFKLSIVEILPDGQQNVVIDSVPYTMHGPYINIRRDFVEQNILPLLK